MTIFAKKGSSSADGEHRDDATRPYLLKFRSSKAFITSVVAYSVFTDQFAFAVVVPIMPFTLHDRAGVSEASGNILHPKFFQLQTVDFRQVQYWVAVLLAVYGAATTAASPIWGWYADRHTSRRLPFLSGLAIVAAATVMIWLSRTTALQVLGRVLQGLAAAIVWVTGLAMIADSVDEAEIGQYAGYLGIAMMVGTLIGPLLGGVVLAKGGYNTVFGMTLGVIGVDIALRLILIEKTTASAWIQEPLKEPEEGQQQDDLEGNTRGQMVEQKQPDAEVISVDAPERKRKRLPAVLRLLSSRRLCVALWASFAVGTIFAGFETVLPIHTQEAFGWNSEGAGLIFLPLTLPFFLGPIVGWICDKFGPRWPMTVGFVGLCPVLTLLRYVDHNSLEQKVLLCALLVIAACCFTVTLDPVMAEVAYVVAAKAQKNPEAYSCAGNKVYAQAFGLFNTAYSLGCTLGPIIAGMIKDSAGWSTMGWVLGLLGGLTAIPVFLWSGKPAPQNRQ